MNIKELIAQDLKKAMKEKNSAELTVLRGLVSVLNNKLIESKAKGEEALSEEEQIKTLQSEAKKRKESIEAYKNAERKELMEQEEKELGIINRYLPKQLEEAELEAIVDEVIKSSETKEFGPLIRAVMEQVQGKADGKTVSSMLQKKLQA